MEVKTRFPTDRPDWSEVKDRIDLAVVATALLGPAPGRRGDRGRLWWSCPFHDDKNPSFVIVPGTPWWHCFGCGEHGDAMDLVRRLNPGWSFQESATWLAEQAGVVPATSRFRTASVNPAKIRPRPAARPPAKAPDRPVKQASGLPLADALALVESAAGRLWTPEGGAALAYLRGRGLTEATIKAGRLGWTPGASIPVKDGSRFWTVPGTTIPWLDGDRLAMVKIRLPDEFLARIPEDRRPPRYAQAFQEGPSIYPRPSVIEPGEPLVIVEGELDALLLGQELTELAAVVTLGSASARPEGSIYLAMLPSPAWYVATDADDAGDKAASKWPPRARRVRPPIGKDWTEARQAGVNLRRWWTDRLGGIESPALFTWDDQASRRWGPAVGDSEPGVIIDGPVRRFPATVEER
jgi:hypothetical protein